MIDKIQAENQANVRRDNKPVFVNMDPEAQKKLED